jgi:hypothetical protein
MLWEFVLTKINRKKNTFGRLEAQGLKYKKIDLGVF